MSVTTELRKLLKSYGLNSNKSTVGTLDNLISEPIKVYVEYYLDGETVDQVKEHLFSEDNLYPVPLNLVCMEAPCNDGTTYVYLVGKAAMTYAEAYEGKRNYKILYDDEGEFVSPGIFLAGYNAYAPDYKYEEKYGSIKDPRFITGLYGASVQIILRFIEERTEVIGEFMGKPMTKDVYDIVDETVYNCVPHPYMVKGDGAYSRQGTVFAVTDPLIGNLTGIDTCYVDIFPTGDRKLLTKSYGFIEKYDSGNDEYVFEKFVHTIEHSSGDSPIIN